MAKGTTKKAWDINGGDLIKRFATDNWLIVLGAWNHGPEKRQFRYLRVSPDGWVDPKVRSLSCQNGEEWHIPINGKWLN